MSGEGGKKREIDEKLRRDIDLIIGRLHGKRVQLRERLEVGFVDREREARTILEGVAGMRLLGGTVVLYGPWGCGKSTLVEKLTESIREVSESGKTLFDAVYVKWDEAEKVVKAISSESLSEIIFNAIKSLDPSVSLEGGVIVSAALSLTRFFGSVIDALQRSKKAREHGRILLVMDERSVKTQKDAREFESELDSLADEMRRANLEYYQEKKGFLTALVLASDALAAEAWQKVSIKAGWLFMWNLPRGDFERLVDQLGVNVDRDLLWSLAGGNPRALGYIAENGFNTWLEKEIVEKVKSAINKYYKEHRDNPDRVWSHIVEAAGEPLGFLGNPLEDSFLESNIIITGYSRADIISEMPRMPTIGRANAYQIPAYYYALRAIAKRGASILPKIMEVEIPPEEVIEEARRISGTERQ